MQVVAYPPGMADGEGDALATRSYETHQAEVLMPLLLAAMLTQRVGALPALPCAATSWRAPSYADHADTQVYPRNYSWAEGSSPACRHGACP